MMCRRQGNGTQARILVVDWDHANSHALASVMRTAGFKVATACDGLDAVAEATHFHPDLLLTEPYLGRLSGIEAAARINAALPDCRVLFLSGEASMSDIAKAAPPELVYSFTSKPIHPLDLLNAVAYLVSAVWSMGGSKTHRSALNHAAQDRPQPAAPAPLDLHRRPGSEPVAPAPDSSARYFRAPLALKREPADRHKKNRNQHAPACT